MKSKLALLILFAMVAGELDVLEDSFTTMTGRDVALKVFVDPGMARRAECCDADSDAARPRLAHNPRKPA